MGPTVLHPEAQPGEGTWLFQRRKRKRRPSRKDMSSLTETPVDAKESLEYPSPVLRNPQTFLRPNVAVVRDTVDIGGQGPGKSICETFLRTYGNGKERLTSPDAAVPATSIVNRFLLWHDDSEIPCSPPSQGSIHQTQPTYSAHTMESKAVDNNNNNNNNNNMASETRLRGLPPHLRKNNAQSQITVDATPTAKDGDPEPATEHKTVQNHDLKSTPKASTIEGANKDIRRRLDIDYGVKVSSPVPLRPGLMSYSSSNDGIRNATPGFKSYPTPSSQGGVSRGNPVIRSPRGGGRGRTTQASSRGKLPYSNSTQHPNHIPVGAPKVLPTTPSTTESKRGQSATKCNRGGRGGRQPRPSRWPTAAETRPDPKRWDITWPSSERSFSSADSARADSGFGDGKKKMRKQIENGIDPDTGFKLTDWTGGWAPAPVDWDARPAFRDGQSAQKIEQWLDVIESERRRAVGGKSWAISTEDITHDGTTYHFAPDPQRKDLHIMGDPAPRYWIPVVFGHKTEATSPMAPQIFWNHLVNSEKPKSCDDEDLVGVKPWWENYHIPGGEFLKPYESPVVEGVDPEENDGERIAREHDHGSNHHTENRQRAEKAKKEAKRERRRKAQEKANKISRLFIEQFNNDSIKPAIKLFVRSARPEDLGRIQEIYNHYVDFSISAPETIRRTKADMQMRLNDVRRNLLPFLVACEPGGKLPGRRQRGVEEDIILPDKVVGFAMADDFNDIQGMYRFTAEIEFYTDRDYYMKGVAKCMLDKLMGLLDPHYLEKGGYEVVGEDLDSSGSGRRRISNIIMHFPYDSGKHDRVEWIEKWLSGWMGFQKVGDIPGIGLKQGKVVNLAIFLRKTGEEINPLTPPVMMTFPS